jgi:uncharacterized protein
MHEQPRDVTRLDYSRIAQDLQIRKVQVEAVVALLDEGNTVPFITRYRKERTGGLNEEGIRAVQARATQLRQLAERKQTILKSIEGQGKLTDQLRDDILAAETARRLEDLYLPYKPKKRTLAMAAREKGLEALALAVWNRDPAVANLQEMAVSMVNPEKELATPEDVLTGVQHILAEGIAETADVRATVRFVLWETGRLCTGKNEKVPEGHGLDFKDYFQFTEPIRQVPPHRVLAINRGEKEGVLAVRIEFDQAAVDQSLFVGAPHRPAALPLGDHPHGEFLKKVAADSLTRLILPSLEREIRKELSMKAEGHAVDVFARNLGSLLLAAPLRNRRVLAVDPGFRSGCKLAALDEIGNLLEEAVIFPHAPQSKKVEARHKLEQQIRKHHIQVIAIGNGTACRESEELVSDLIMLFDKRRRGEVVEEPKPAPPAPVEAQAAPPVPEAPPTPVSAAEAPANAAPAAPAEAAPTTPAPAVEAPATVAPEPSTEAAAATAPATDATPAESAPPVAAASAPATPAPPPLVLPPLDDLPEPLLELAYVIVNEAGASVYSASAVGREEFPNFDATLRGTISIGRRLQDPLSELVKIDPQNIGVGLYQHDVHPKHLKESLEVVIESCVNHVGVDLNTASVPLLRHVSGLNQLVARELVDYRKTNGPFRNREQLLQVPSMGPARYVQAAGFLKIDSGEEPLDRTWIHPESYAVARQLLTELGFTPAVLDDKSKTDELRQRMKAVAPEEVAARLQIGVMTLRDILESLSRPGRDPREDLPPPIFKKGILKLEDLQPGMELKGTILNVVDFGAFIDVGLKDSGLIHISQLANRYVKSPYDVVAVGDVVTAWVLTVDKDRHRVSLTMVKPGTDRKPPERRPPQRREEQPAQAGSDHPPRERRHEGPPRGRGPGQERPGRGRGPARGRGPVPGRGPAPAQGAPAQAAPPPAAAGQAPPPRTPPPPPRKPHRQGPKPKLSQAALQGKAPLHTFGELEVFFSAKRNEEKPAPPPPPQPVQAEPPPTAADSEALATPSTASSPEPAQSASEAPV